MKMMRRMPHAGQQGFTLIEVLVAMLVLMIGLLGVAGMQLVSFQNNQSAYLRTQATLVAGEFLDRIRANPEAHLTGTAYDAITVNSASTAPADPGCSASAGGCTSAQVVNQDIREWSNHFINVYSQADYRPTLPQGSATVTRAAGNEFTVTVAWEERDWAVVGSEVERQGGQARSVQLRTVLQ